MIQNSFRSADSLSRTCNFCIMRLPGRRKADRASSDWHTRHPAICGTGGGCLRSVSCKRREPRDTHFPRFVARLYHMRDVEKCSGFQSHSSPLLFTSRGSSSASQCSPWNHSDPSGVAANGNSRRRLICRRDASSQCTYLAPALRSPAMPPPDQANRTL